MRAGSIYILLYFSILLLARSSIAQYRRSYYLSGYLKAVFYRTALNRNSKLSDHKRPQDACVRSGNKQVNVAQFVQKLNGQSEKKQLFLLAIDKTVDALYQVTPLNHIIV